MSNDMHFVFTLVACVLSGFLGAVCVAAYRTVNERRTYMRGKADGIIEGALSVERCDASHSRALINQSLKLEKVK